MTDKLLSRTLSIFFLKKGFMSGLKPDMKPFSNTSIKRTTFRSIGRLDSTGLFFCQEKHAAILSCFSIADVRNNPIAGGPHPPL